METWHLTNSDRSGECSRKAQPISSVESNECAGLTRRGFIASAAAAAATLFLSPIAKTTNGFLYAAPAYATTGEEEPEYEVFAITKSELGICVVDVTENAKIPVAGAKVTLTLASDDSKSISATADDKGRAVLNLDGFAEEVDLGGSCGKVLRFDGRIKIEGTDDYRIFKAGRIRTDGGSGIEAPLRKKDGADVPYFQLLCFDEWDIQYTENEFFRSIANTDTHTISGEIALPSDGTANVYAYKKDKDGNLETYPFLSAACTATDGVAPFSFEGRFLNEKQSDCLPLDTKFVFRIEVGAATYDLESKLGVIQAVDEDVEALADRLEPAEGGGEAPIVTFPKSWPAPFGGSQITVWVPTLPVNIWVSPCGIFSIEADFSLFHAENTGSAFDKASWKKESRKSAKEQIASWANDRMASFIKYANMASGTDFGGNKVDKVSFSKALDATVDVQVSATMLYDYSDKLWHGDIGFILQAILEAKFTWDITIGPVPVFITLQPSLSAKFAAKAATLAKTWKGSDFTFDYNNTAVSLTASIGIALTVGAGIDGVASIGLRGSGYISFYVGFYEVKRKGKLPHCCIGGGIKAELVVQFLIFKWAGKIWGIDDPTLADNWSESDSEAKAMLTEGSPMAGHTELALGAGDGNGAFSEDAPVISSVSLTDFAANASIVTEGELLRSKEGEGKPDSSANVPTVDTFASLTRVSAGKGNGGKTIYGQEMYDVSKSGKLSDGYKVAYVGKALKAACNGKANVAAFAKEGGIRPSLDVKIAQDVFSNPCQKTVIYNETPYMFRIITVEYDTPSGKAARTRLAWQKYDKGSGQWSDPKVFDMPVYVPHAGGFIERIDTFDYDFDVMAVDKGTRGIPAGFYIALCSNWRKNGDKTSFADAFSSPVMTLSFMDESLELGATDCFSSPDGTDDDRFVYSFSCPRITQVTSGSDPYAVAVAFLARTAADADKLLSGDCVTEAYCHFMSSAVMFKGASVQVDNNATDLVIGDCPDAKSSRDAGISIVARSDKGIAAYTMSLSLTAKSGDMRIDYDSRKCVNEDEGAGITNVRTWPGHSEILISKDGRLYSGSYDVLKVNSPLTLNEVGPADHAITSFLVSNDGKMIFFTENGKGKNGQSYDDTGTPSAVEGERYCLHACSYVSGLFSAMFPLADVSHPIDLVCNVNVGSTYQVIASSITSMENSTADLYFTEVPYVSAITTVSLVSENNFVNPGNSEEPFIMELRNDGNTILKGCKISFCDADTKHFVNIIDEYEFKSENVIACGWTPEKSPEADPEVLAMRKRYNDEVTLMSAMATGNAHPLADPVNAGVLLPGQTARYRVKFPIPEDWKGSKKVYLVLEDYKVANESNAALTGSPVVHFSQAPEDVPTCDANVQDSADVTLQGISDAPMVKVGADGKPTILPVTGADELSQTSDTAAIGALGLAAAALGAGALAYSSRRVANEKRRQAEKE